VEITYGNMLNFVGKQVQKNPITPPDFIRSQQQVEMTYGNMFKFSGTIKKESHYPP
jgi:hypothetical protein